MASVYLEKSQNSFMKAIILAGGLGTRLSEETNLKPKPMVEIGGRPIIWHIMKLYYQAGVKDFIVLCGYKGNVLKDFFANYRLHSSNVKISSKGENIDFLGAQSEDWSVTLVDSGEHTMTGGRLAFAKPFLDPNESFCLTYGDGVSDVDIRKLIAFHKNHSKAATVTAVHPPSRFGILDIDGTEVRNFEEKPDGEQGWINGGFFVLDYKVLDYIDGPDTIWEQYPLRALAAEGQLQAFEHQGFWQSMDTLRDCAKLEELWQRGNAPWQTWP